MVQKNIVDVLKSTSSSSGTCNVALMAARCIDTLTCQQKSLRVDYHYNCMVKPELVRHLCNVFSSTQWSQRPSCL